MACGKMKRWVASVSPCARPGAIDEMNALGISGKESTPFLLAKIKDLTGGESLKTNIALVYNNVALAAKIAAAMKK